MLNVANFSCEFELFFEWRKKTTAIEQFEIQIVSAFHWTFTEKCTAAEHFEHWKVVCNLTDVANSCQRLNVETRYSLDLVHFE